MDIDTPSFQTDFLGPSIVSGVARSTDNSQMSGGLMRYHSAPSSMLASLLDDDFFTRSSEPELDRFLSDALEPSSSLCDSRLAYQTDKVGSVSAMNGIKEQQHLDHSRRISQQTHYLGTGGSSLTESLNRGPLSAIFEHGLEESINSFCTPQLPVTSNQQVAAHSAHQSTRNSNSHDPLPTSGPNFSGLPQVKSGLIRHSSSPADFLSRLVMEESSERPASYFSGSYMQPAAAKCLPEGNSVGKECSHATTGPPPGAVASFSARNCFNGVSRMGKANDDLVVGDGKSALLSGPTKNGLLRQSSSPAGLLSQLSLDGVSTAGEKASMSSSSGNSSEEGTFDSRETALMANYVASGWDEAGTGCAAQNLAALGQRKRGRGIEANASQGLIVTDTLQRFSDTPTPNHFSITASTNPGSALSMEMSMVDSVPCRARAKRGCATHPRSIAERVRRTKISERMRKLQELVPNMDKQTNTADMLDEAVQYVKFLQRQVQELSEKQTKCNGICQQKGNVSPQKL